MFNCSPSFNLQLTSYTSSPAVQPSPYLPSSGRLQVIFRTEHFPLMETQTSQFRHLQRVLISKGSRARQLFS